MLAARIAARASTAAFRPRMAARAFSVAAVRLGAHGPAEPFVGPGSKPGTIPTELEQSTGPERFEYLRELEGKEAFDMKPLEPTHMGTPAQPIVVQSVEDVRYVGCTGFPVDSHDTLWIRVNKEKGVDRCPECGCCFQLKRVEPPTHH